MCSKYILRSAGVWTVCLFLLSFAAVAGADTTPSVLSWFFLPLGTGDCSLLSGLRPGEIRSGTTPRILATQRASKPGILPTWQPARFPHAGFDATNPGREVFGWYGCVLQLPEKLVGSDLILHLGVIDDADIAYVNGRPVGRNGDFDNRGSAWTTDRQSPVFSVKTVATRFLFIARR